MDKIVAAFLPFFDMAKSFFFPFFSRSKFSYYVSPETRLRYRLVNFLLNSVGLVGLVGCIVLPSFRLWYKGTKDDKGIRSICPAL